MKQWVSLPAAGDASRDMIDALSWAYVHSPQSVVIFLSSLLGLWLLLALRQRFLRPPRVDLPDFLQRHPKGKLCFVTNPFSCAESLALVDRLLGRGAYVVLLCHPDDASDPNVLQLFALLKHNHPAGSTFVYIEPVDLTSPEEIRSFAETFEKKGAKRAGAMGEIVGRLQITGLICFSHPSRSDILHALHLARALMPSFRSSVKEENPDPVLQRGGGPADFQVRVIAVVPSLRYAAASVQQLLTVNAPKVKQRWQRDAVGSLMLALLMNEAQQQLCSEDNPDVLFLSYSTGLTRAKFSEAIYNILPSSLFTVMFHPLVLFFGKSGTEAALGVEWALLHPHQGSAPPALDVNPNKLIQPGAFYRDGINAGRLLPEFADPQLGKQLWEEHLSSDST